MKDHTLFQYCQKIVILREGNEVLLAQRRGEQDYDGVYSFIGGKLETTDGSILAGLKREKEEEIGKVVVLSILPYLSCNAYFVKSNGQHMILPHYYAEYIEGEILLNPEEYSGYKWVKITDLEVFEPKIPNITSMVDKVLELKSTAQPADFIKI